MKPFENLNLQIDERIELECRNDYSQEDRNAMRVDTYTAKEQARAERRLYTLISILEEIEI